MCFSFEVSLYTGLFSWASGLYILSKNNISQYNREFTIFLLIFSLMQFSDAILWYIDMKQNNINYIVTSFVIPIILSLQIIYNIYYRSCCCFFSSKYTIRNNNTVMDIIVFQAIVYLFYRFNGYSKSSCTNKLSSPIWGSTEIELWEILGFLILIAMPDIYVILLEFFILYFVKLIINGGIGSMWCAIANILAVYLLYATY